MKGLDSWVRENVRSLIDATHTQHRIDEIYIQATPEMIIRDRDPCIVTFCILLEIGQGHLIYGVQREGIADAKLPIAPGLLEETFMRIDEHHGAVFAQRFHEAQWKYCPLIFDSNIDKNFPAEQVFPICRKREIGRGGQARVFQILVQEEYVTPNLVGRLAKDEHTRIEDNKFGWVSQHYLESS